MSNILDIDSLVEPLSLLYHALDTQLFLNIVKELNLDIEDGGSDKWLDTKTLAARQISMKNAKIINQFNKLIVPAMNKVIANMNSTGEDTRSITAVLNNFKKDTTKLINYTNTSCLQASNKKYLEIVNTAYLDVQTGLRTFEQSVTRATKQLADEGIQIQTYENDTVINVRSGVARNIRTQTARASRDIQDAYAKDFDLSLFEISSHAGARPLCYPFQGRIYDGNNKSGTVKDVNGKEYEYKAFSTTSFGEKAGIFGINCTHMKYYIDEGLFTKAFDVYKKKENDIIYTYDQKVKYFENEIQKEKRRLEGFQVTRNKNQEIISKLRLKEKRKKLKDFKEENLDTIQKLSKQAIK
jgi:hypothetical protein